MLMFFQLIGMIFGVWVLLPSALYRYDSYNGESENRRLPVPMNQPIAGLPALRIAIAPRCLPSYHMRVLWNLYIECFIGISIVTLLGAGFLP